MHDQTWVLLWQSDCTSIIKLRTVSRPSLPALQITCSWLPEPCNMLLMMQIEQMRSAGVEPFAYSFGVSHTAVELQQTYRDLPNGELADLDGSPIAVAGRIMTRRFLGKKLAFFTLQDATGSIQLYIEKGLMEADSPMPFG